MRFIHIRRAFSYTTKWRFHHQLMRFRETATRSQVPSKDKSLPVRFKARSKLPSTTVQHALKAITLTSPRLKLTKNFLEML